MRIAKPLVAIFAVVVALLLAVAGGCASNNKGAAGGLDFGEDSGGGQNFGDDSGGSGSGSSSGGPSGIVPFDPGDDSGASANCPAGSPLSCYVSMCSGSAHTTLTGKVYDPAGKNPLYNVIVFVPNYPSQLPAIVDGTSTCNTCAAPVGDYVAVALTDKTGSFTLTDVPTGKNVPLVVQIGKWRRVINVANVADCKTTAVPDSGAGQARLPRSQSEGSLPKMALLTGGLDDLGCFMTRMGIAASEYSAPGAGGRLDIYQGFGLGGAPGPGLSSGTAGNCTNTSCPLWSSKKSLEAYDIVLLACEGDPYDQNAGDGGGGLGLGGGAANVTTASKQSMHDWLNEGGKVFATHFHYTWFMNGPPDFQSVATWLGASIGAGMCTNCTIDTSFIKGQNFHDWLQTVGALNGAGITLTGMATSVSAVNTKTTSRWIYDPGSIDGKMDTKYLSFETPIGGLPLQPDAGETGPQYCGKAVFTDLHAGGAPSGNVPGMCTTGDLSAQEKALEYLFFDLSACVTDDTKPPPVPPQPPK
jgi:hypothetical protein